MTISIVETGVRCKRCEWLSPDMPKPDGNDVCGWLQWAIFVTDADDSRLAFLASLLQQRTRYGALTERQMDALSSVINRMLQTFADEATA